MRVGKEFEVSPKEQERRSAASICQFLNQTSGRDWRVETWLDDLYQHEPSPDALLTDGTHNIAVEIKQLTDGHTFDAYGLAQQSLYRRLAPDSNRQYVLIPPPTFRLPLKPKWVTNVKHQLTKTAPELRVGETVELPIPRQATVRFLGQSDAGVVFCGHARNDDVLAISPNVEGCFVLEDGGEPDHQFLSEESRLEFQQTRRRACEDSRLAGTAVIEWREQWKLLRDPDPAEGQGGVFVVAAVANFIESAAIESVEKAIQDARKKFVRKQWGGRTAVALQAGEQQHELTGTLFQMAIARLEAADVQPLDTVFLIDGAQVSQFDFNG